MEEATLEFVNETESSNIFIEELSSECSTLLQDLRDDYFDVDLHGKKILKIQTEWTRVVNFIKTIDTLNFMIRKHCADIANGVERWNDVRNKLERSGE